VSLALSLANSLREQINDGSYRPGQKLPSIRQLAKDQGCSINTVIDGLETLVAAGLIEPRRGSGFFVLHAEHREPSRDDEPSSLERAMDIVWLMREQLKTTPGTLSVGDGFPPVSWLDESRLDRYYQKVVRTGMGSLFRYGSRCGYLPLRQHLVGKLAGLGIDCKPNQIVLTHGANQAMDIVIRHFIRPGDTVLVDDPGYYPLLGKLMLNGANIVGVARLADGPDVAALEQAMAAFKPKLFFTQSVGQNPTGSDITPAKAHRVLQLAEKHDVIIVENDPLADFKPHTMTRIATLDQLQRTIYLGSFSKSISAALRVGFIACHPDLASDLADVKMLVHVSSSEYCERTVDIILSEGYYLRNVSKLCERVERATAASVKILESLGAEIFARPSESLYLWCRFPDRDDAAKLAGEFMAQKVVMAPGNIFSVDSQATSPWCRCNVGFVTDPRFLAAARSIFDK